jgi:hypothetical protein
VGSFKTEGTWKPDNSISPSRDESRVFPGKECGKERATLNFQKPAVSLAAALAASITADRVIGLASPKWEFLTHLFRPPPNQRLTSTTWSPWKLWKLGHSSNFSSPSPSPPSGANAS